MPISRRRKPEFLCFCEKIFNFVESKLEIYVYAVRNKPAEACSTISPIVLTKYRGADRINVVAVCFVRIVVPLSVRAQSFA